MSKPKLTYRLFRREDLPGVLRLWEAESGWGSLGEADFDTWYMNTPHGESVISVAVDADNYVYAQCVFFPMRTVVNGRVVKSLHMSAPILDASLRTDRLTTMVHPLIQVYFAAEKEAQRLGYELIFATPQRGWLPFFRWGTKLKISHFDRIKYACAARPVRDDLPTVEGVASLKASQATSIGEEYDRLWQQAVESFPLRCANVRDAKWISWRNGDHRVVEARDDSGELAGYASIRGDGLVVDVLARRPDELCPVVMAVTRWLREAAEAGDETVPRDIKLMRHATLEPTVAALGFADIDFEFAFTVNAFGESLDRRDAAPENWYVMPLY